MSAITARGAVVRPTIALEQTKPTKLSAPRAFAAVSGIARWLSGLLARGIEPTRAARTLSDPEQIRRLAPPDVAVDNLRWQLVMERYAGPTR